MRRPRPHWPVVSSAARGCRLGRGLRPVTPSDSSSHGKGHCPLLGSLHSTFPTWSPAQPSFRGSALGCFVSNLGVVHSFTYSELSPKPQPPHQAPLKWWWGCQIRVLLKKRRNKMPEMSGVSRVRARGDWGGRCAARMGLPEKVIFEGGREAMCLAGGGELQAAGTASAKAPRQEESRPTSVAGAEVRRRRGPAPVLQGLWNRVQA